MSEKKRATLTVLVVAALVVVTAYAWATGRWVLTDVPMTWAAIVLGGLG